jgi:hypothetical protein
MPVTSETEKAQVNSCETTEERAWRHGICCASVASAWSSSNLLLKVYEKE